MFEPNGNLDVANLAVPALSVFVARTVAPFRNLTIPEGVPLYWGATVAVKVTDRPKLDGFREEAKVVALVALLTAWLTAFDLLPRNFESPPYTALIEWVPIGCVEVVKLADPPPNAPVPNIVVPSTKVTVSPSGGAPMLEVTTARSGFACSLSQVNLGSFRFRIELMYLTLKARK